MAHASLYGSSSWMIHTVDCLRVVSSLCSSLPPCSEMMLEQVTWISQSLPPEMASHACSYGSSLCMSDTVESLRGLLSQSSSPPPCSEMLFQHVTLIQPIMMVFRLVLLSQSLPLDMAPHASSYGSCFWMRHTADCLRADSSRCSSLPPCSDDRCCFLCVQHSYVFSMSSNSLWKSLLHALCVYSWCFVLLLEPTALQ